MADIPLPKFLRFEKFPKWIASIIETTEVLETSLLILCCNTFQQCITLFVWQNYNYYVTIIILCKIK
jgi:hypothetical protein